LEGGGDELKLLDKVEGRGVGGGSKDERRTLERRKESLPKGREKDQVG